MELSDLAEHIGADRVTPSDGADTPASHGRLRHMTKDEYRAMRNDMLRVVLTNSDIKLRVSDAAAPVAEAILSDLLKQDGRDLDAEFCDPPTRAKLYGGVRMMIDGYVDDMIRQLILELAACVIHTTNSRERHALQDAVSFLVRPQSRTTPPSTLKV